MKSLIIFTTVSLALAAIFSVVVIVGIAWTHAPFTLKDFMTDLFRMIAGKDD